MQRTDEPWDTIGWFVKTWDISATNSAHSLSCSYNILHLSDLSIEWRNMVPRISAAHRTPPHYTAPLHTTSHYLLLVLPRAVRAVRKGPFVAGQNSNFHGKILYKQCRKPVYTPSDWDPALADRSSDLPAARLVLEFVYGYQGE